MKHLSLFRYNYRAGTLKETWVTSPLISSEAKRMINQGISMDIIKNELYKNNKAEIEKDKQSQSYTKPKEGLDN